MRVRYLTAEQRTVSSEDTELFWLIFDSVVKSPSRQCHLLWLLHAIVLSSLDDQKDSPHLQACFISSASVTGREDWNAFD